MSRIAYVNGRYLPHCDGMVHIEDRGYQFADGVYEVTAVRNGRMIDSGMHLERLGRSLSELQIDMPMTPRAILTVMEETARRNRVRDGIVYTQVTRGVARRDHAFPRQVRPAVVMTAKSMDFAALARKAGDGVKVVSLTDIRWGRCDIKSVSLLPNCLAKQEAKDRGAFEAWMVDAEGYVTEGSSTNAWIVDAEGRIVTRDVSPEILNGITRRALLQLAAEAGTEIVERRFTLEEAKGAREAFLTSTTSFVMPVVEIDGQPVGNGAPGMLTERLRRSYVEHALAE
ncbi:MAG: D-amino-acid transaminase [Sneathiellaceae bacterium]